MNLSLNRQHLLKAGLMVALSALITLMIAPNLNLVPARYEEGDIIPETIVIPENVNLLDERSTEARREQALAEFPPIYDFDPRLRNKTAKAVQATFQQMRDRLAALRKAIGEAQEKLRSNSLQRIAALAQERSVEAHLEVVRQQRRYLISEIGALSDLAEPTPVQAARLEKLRFDLMAIETQRVNAEQELKQLSTQRQELRQASGQLKTELTQATRDEAQAMPRLKAAFEKELGVTLGDAHFRVLYDEGFNQDLEQKVLQLTLPVYDEKIVSSLEGFAQDKNTIQINALESDKLDRFEALDTIVDVAGMRERIAKRGGELKFPGDAGPKREAVVALAQRLVRPNLTENKGATERQKQELLKSLSPVYFSLKKGDVVARAGDVATAQQVEIIRALNAYNLKNPKYPQIIGTFLIVLLALGIVYRLIVQRARNGETGLSRLVLMSLLLLVTLLIAQVILLVVPALSTVYDFIPPSTYNYLIPAALTSMLAGIVLSFEVAVYLGFVVSLCLAILLGNSLSFFIYALLGSFAAAIPLSAYESRYALWQQGLRISAMNVAVLLVLTLLDQAASGWTLAVNLGGALLNGLGVAFLTATLLPLIENLFDITTNLKLLELSNMNHPALKELAVRAPGTYHHSIVVGNLSESSAEGIQANPLLVRVASYYHDLGKMLCPLYFVENQGKKNYHDDLPARTSARIIINHVKDGLEIARRYKLGRAITDIIAQHHGDSLVRYFFHKAQEEQRDLDETPEEGDFHYPGPKPQTKEAGLVMVADVTEAATRSLSDPSPASIRQMVQKLTTRVYMEGQLDQSGMTFNDLNFIEKTFTKMLISIHHHRISYPELQVGMRQQPYSEEPREPAVAPQPLPVADPPGATAEAESAGPADPDDPDRPVLGRRRASS